MTKGALRQHWAAMRDAIPNRKEKSHSLCLKLLQSEAYQKANTIMTYLSFRSEPETHDLLKIMVADGKRVAVPLCDPQTHTMQGILIEDFSRLRKGHYGILEPDPQGATAISADTIDLIIVPGLAFDQQGYRLGYGGGYYDRYLENYKGISIGLAFSACVTETLTPDSYDIPVDWVLSE